MSEKNLNNVLLATLGLFPITAFLLIFANIPWEWNLFMDDFQYNSWMPHVTNIGDAFLKEIKTYWALGRFYPVKYLANLLKWGLLPNDPFVFRVFNLSVFGISAILLVKSLRLPLSLTIFLVGSVFFHKPLLEIIALNPLGETWVVFFLSLGVFSFTRENFISKELGSRLCFLLAYLAKEPACFIFLALASVHALSYFVNRAETQKTSIIPRIFVDLSLFIGSLGLSFYVMQMGSFTKTAYFASPSYLIYLYDFLYSQLRYMIWIAPLLFVIFYGWWKQGNVFWKELPKSHFNLFWLGIIFSYLYFGFMSTQGRVAYQQVPASWGLYLAISILFAHASERSLLTLFSSTRLATLFLLLFCFSLFISLSRWERFVRGYVEPSKFVPTLLSLSNGKKQTLVVPASELSGHLERIVAEEKLPIEVVALYGDPTKLLEKSTGEILLLEFPIYMGELPADWIEKVRLKAGGWKKTQDFGSFRIYRGN